nr:MAG TPA: hypothetical protein [Caudoviricetes sp.]
MSESKTFILPDGGQSGSMMPLLASLCQQRGIDPNMLLAMKNNSGFGGEGGWFMWVIFLLIFTGWGGNGFGWGNQNGNLPNMINNDAGRELLMSAIQGNGNAIGQLATTLNCDIKQINSTLQAMATQLQNSNSQLASQLAQCCCDNKMAICQQTNTLQSTINGVGNAMERGFSDNAFRMQTLACDLKTSANDNTRAILGKLDQIEDSRKDREIASLTAQLTASQSRAERQSELQPIYKALSDIQGKQPNTVPVQWPQIKAFQENPLCASSVNYLYNPYSPNFNGWA